MEVFKDRYDAGRKLAAKLIQYSDQPDVMILALPRGGVPVGLTVAKQLHAPLDVFIVRKLGVPSQPELALGAIASGGIQILNEDVVSATRLTPGEFNHVLMQEKRELERRDHFYRGERPPLDLSDRTVILVDDGLATGASMKAAAAAVRKRDPWKIVVAVPVGIEDCLQELKHFADEVVCAYIPERFSSVGAWYEDFSEVSDDEVRRLLQPATVAAHA